MRKTENFARELIFTYYANRRLILRYGEKSALHIQSHRGMGTCISFSIPMDGVATQ